MKAFINQVQLILFMCAGDIFDKGSYKFLDILEKLNEEKISSIIFRAK